MANLLETMLSSGKLKRQDSTHLTVPRRPMPARPRQLLELFGAMGVAATFQGMSRGLQLKDVDPHQTVFATLGRWPTNAEIADFPEPYEARPHLTALIRSREFRSHIVRLAMDGFPERHRILFVQIPRSAGENVLTAIDGRHPLLPTDLATPRYNNPATLVEALGHVFSRLAASNALALAQPAMAIFVDQAPHSAKGPDPIAWRTSAPPCRSGDLLFAIMRDPLSRALSQINALMAAIHAGDLPLPATLAATLGADAKRPRLSDWRQPARDILADTLLPNPICHALGDGTVDGALQACARSPIRLVAIEQYRAWARSALDSTPPDHKSLAEICLRPEDLTPRDRDIIAAATRHDQIIYDRFTKRIKATGLPAIPGREL